MDMEQLQPLIGHWDVEMTMPTNPPMELTGWTTFEWLEGGSFVIQRWDVAHPQAPGGIAILGPGEAEGEFIQHYFDGRGVERQYVLRLEEGVVTLHREHPGFSQRYTGTFSTDGSVIDGAWEKCEDGQTWVHDFDLIYTARH
jgi:hypothetical protein